MAERSTEESIHDDVDFSVRSPLLMPVMEGNTLGSDDVAEFLKGRLSLLSEWTAPLSSTHLS